MVMVDHNLTKGVIFTPANKELTALKAAEFYFNIQSNNLKYQTVSYLIEIPFFFQKLTKVKWNFAALNKESVLHTIPKQMEKQIKQEL